MTTRKKPSATTTAPSLRKSVSNGVENVANEAKSELERIVDTSRGHMTEWKGGLQDGVRAKPLQSILIAAAVGGVLGAILGRSHA